eukprot:1887734-Alexandrium_andersonii.AAC.1
MIRLTASGRSAGLRFFGKSWVSGLPMMPSPTPLPVTFLLASLSLAASCASNCRRAHGCMRC